MATILVVASGSAGRSTLRSAIVLVGSGVAVGSALGALVALVGALIGPPERELLALLGSVAVLVGLVKLRPPQFDRETLTRWLEFGDWRTALLNGLELGTGFMTRLGYWLWYLVPLGCFVASDWLTGALIWACYSLTRLAGSAGLAIASRPGIYRAMVRTGGANRLALDMAAGVAVGVYGVRLAALVLTIA